MHRYAASWLMTIIPSMGIGQYPIDDTGAYNDG